MKHDEILEIQDWAEGHHHKGTAELLTNDIIELCQLALQATEPGMVMVPMWKLECWRHGGGIISEDVHDVMHGFSGWSEEGLWARIEETQEDQP